MTTCLAIIQCRTASTRLPKKVLLPFYQQQTILELVSRRVVEVFGRENTLIATSSNASDDAVANWAQEFGVGVVRGDEEDVMNRFKAAIDTGPDCDFFCRVCADNPFLCRDGLRQLRDAVCNLKVDYVSFRFRDGTPSILSHCGLYAEVVRTDTFIGLVRQATSKRHREHITTYFLDHPDQFEMEFLAIPEYVENCRNLRLTVDSQVDFGVASELYGKLVQKFGEAFDSYQVVQEVCSGDDYLSLMQNEIKKNEKK